MNLPSPTSARWLTIGISLLVTAAAMWPDDDPTVELQLVATPDAWQSEHDWLLTGPIKLFNDQHVTAADGSVIHVTPDDLDSGEAEDRISSQTLQPDIWIPASTMWGDLLNADAEGSEEPVAPHPPIIARSPQVFAMWESVVHRLGSDQSPFGWNDIRESASDPTSGFTFAHTDPNHSTSGLYAALSEYSEAAGNPEELQPPDVEAGGPVVEVIERAIVHYGPTSGDVLDQFACFGTTYASALYVQNSSVGRFNDGRYDPTEPSDCPAADHERLIPIEPAGGTYVADYPCIALHHTDDGSNEDASQQFCDWLETYMREHPEHARAHHFMRLGDPKAVPPILEVPDPGVVKAVQQDWPLHRRPADVMLAIDISDSMKEELGSVKVAMDSCLADLMERDRVGLVSFGTTDDLDSPLLPFGDETHAQQLKTAINELRPTRGTALHDGIWRAVETIRSDLRADRIRAVVVITDGFESEEEETSSHTRDQLKRYVSVEDPSDEQGVRLFFVTIGDQVTEIADEMATASQGKSYPSEDEEDLEPGETAIGKACEEVFSFF